MAFRVPERPVSNQPNITGDVLIDAFDHVATIVNIPTGVVSQSWADTLSVSKFSGPWNPHIDAPQYLSFGVEDVIPSVGDIRASGDLHLEANLDGYFHVLGSLFLGGHSSPNDATTVVSDIITFDATTNLVGTSGGTTTLTSVGSTVVSSASGESVLQAGTIARVIGATEAQLTAGTTARINGSDILLWSSDDFFLATGPGGSIRFAISDLGAWYLAGTSPGSPGQVIVSQGPSDPPVWQTIDLSSVTYTAGDGLDLSGNVFSVDVTGIVDGVSIEEVATNNIRRAALTGEVTALAGSNATTIDRSTAFVWTGIHQHTGTAHVVQWLGDVSLASTAGGMWIGAGVTPVVSPDAINNVVDIEAANDVRINGQGGMHISASTALGALQAAGNMVLTADNNFRIFVNATEEFEIDNTGSWELRGLHGAAGQVLTSGGVGAPPSWTTVAGTTYSAGDGIDLSGTTFLADVSDFAGTGLEDDGSNNLRISAAAAGNGLTGGAGSALAVGSSTSLIVGANDVQRAALTGFATAAQNSNVTSSAEPIVTFSASSNMSNERVLSAGSNTTINTTVAGQIRVDATDTTYSSGDSITISGGGNSVNYTGNSTVVEISGATSNLGTIDISALTCGGAVRVTSASSAFSIEGFTAKSDGFWFYFEADLSVTNHCTMFHEDLTATAGNRLALPLDADMSEQGRTRGIFFYRNTRWNWCSSNPQVIGLSPTNYAGFIDQTGGFEVVTSTTDITMTAGFNADVVVNAGGNVELNGDDIRANSHPVMTRTGGSIVSIPAGTTNDLTISSDTTALRRGAAVGTSTITGITGGVDGRLLQFFSIDGSAADLCQFAHDDSGSTAANRIYCPGNGNFSWRNRGGGWLRYDGGSSRWVVLAP